MLNFLRKHWKMLALSALALAAAAAVVFFPPALVAGGIIALASSPVFAVFGSAAAAVATGVVAAAAAAAVFAAGALANGVVKAASWIASKFSRSSHPAANDDALSAESDDEAELVDSPSRTATLLGAARARFDAVADEEEAFDDAHHASPLQAPRLRPVPPVEDVRRELDASPLTLSGHGM
ncbi:hypothetical protein [Legionella nagasakiensis]|uniref:hypothetical protein n=1 Tax=Legionella nagasakiensis TaxID=535290 RepID=UPI001054B4BB|nr:hypothetical protein [Legionella nagasakiensis]